MLRSALIALALVFAGCAPNEADVGQTLSADTLAATHDALQSLVTLHFRADWTVQQSAALAKGGQARIEYDAPRVGNCLGDQGGVPQYAVTAHYVLGDAAEKTMTVAGLIPGGVVPPIDIDRDGELVVWFEITNRWGCHEWDSAFGANYHFTAYSPVSVHFAADFTQTADGSTRGAKALSIDYALQRLPNCRQTYNGLPSWEILAYARFDTGAVNQAVVTRADGSVRSPAAATFAVPAGAHSVELWFMNSDRAGCVGYDSNWSSNYRFDL